MQFPIWSLPINSSSVAVGASEDRKPGNKKAGKKYFYQWLSSIKLELDVTSRPFPGGFAPLPHGYEIPCGKELKLYTGVSGQQMSLKDHPK